MWSQGRTPPCTLRTIAIDLTQIPQPLRGKLIRLGAQYGSQDTLDQANQMLAAYAKQGKLLRGFPAKDAKRLEEARDGLLVTARRTPS